MQAHVVKYGKHSKNTWTDMRTKTDKMTKSKGSKGRGADIYNVADGAEQTVEESNEGQEKLVETGV